MKNRLKDLAVSDTGFVFDPYSGATFSTNATGLAILRGLKSGDTRATIAESLETEFEILEGGDDIERDIDEFVHLLRRNHIVESDFELE